MNGKSDMERVALFQELGYNTIGEPYVAKANLNFNQAASSGKQMVTGTTHSITACNDGYFNTFERGFEGEAYTDVSATRAARIAEGKKKNIHGQPFKPVAKDEKPCGIGSGFGLFQEKYESFSGATNTFNSKETKKNFYTNPSKKGTGYGYSEVTFNKFPQYINSNYDAHKANQMKENEEHKNKLKGRSEFKFTDKYGGYFNKNPFSGQVDKYSDKFPPIQKSNFNPVFRPSNPSRRAGGPAGGCINSFPVYSSEPYISQKPFARSGQADGSKRFLPNTCLKTAPQRSVINQNILYRMNNLNYRSLERVTSY